MSENQNVNILMHNNRYNFILYLYDELFIYFLADLPQKHRPGLAGQISLVKSKNMWYVTVAVKSNDIVSPRKIIFLCLIYQ